MLISGLSIEIKYPTLLPYVPLRLLLCFGLELAPPVKPFGRAVELGLIGFLGPGLTCSTVDDAIKDVWGTGDLVRKAVGEGIVIVSMRCRPVLPV